GGRERLELSVELSAQVASLSRRHGVSEYMTLLAAFAVVLWRYSGQSDIAVGTVLGGRDRAEFEELIGLFVNTMAVRLAVAGETRFEDLLLQVREEVLEGQRHGRVPFERVVEAVEPERSLRHAPLVQVMFLYEGQRFDHGRLRLGAVACEGLEVETATTKFDVTLAVSRTGDRLSAMWEYSLALWEPSTARRMLEAWERVVGSAVAEPSRRLRDLDWV
ncbi:condensation domain-containing protein, partial [Mesorhizobium mediterraneum]|uniref:condensation domain-containing protein n=1 Tax=Mesorhizobium mediterraneum TaxID=43617 RepID=UPI001AEE450C